MCDVFISNVKVDASMVKSTFLDLALGEISRVQIIGGHAHVYFAFWFDTDYANRVKSHLLNNGKVRVFYDFPWFWTCSKNYFPAKGFVSKYNTYNQLRALKSIIDDERRQYTKEIDSQKQEIKRLNSIINKSNT